MITNYIFKVYVGTNKSWWDLKKGFIGTDLASIELVVVVVKTVLHKFVAFYKTGPFLEQALRYNFANFLMHQPIDAENSRFLIPQKLILVQKKFGEYFVSITKFRNRLGKM